MWVKLTLVVLELLQDTKIVLVGGAVIKFLLLSFEFLLEWSRWFLRLRVNNLPWHHLPSLVWWYTSIFLIRIWTNLFPYWRRLFSIMNFITIFLNILNRHAFASGPISDITIVSSFFLPILFLLKLGCQHLHFTIVCLFDVF